jgi:cation diffusion facilitator CzcD-associated flavoprotein CzcO
MTPTRIVIAALGCKRPAYDAGWLTSLHLPNVTLNSVGIASITETSIIDTTGKEFQADVIVFATGSDVARHGVGLNVGLYGEDGVELKEFWKEIGGPQSYRGLAVPGVSSESQPRPKHRPPLRTRADTAFSPNLT